MKNVLKELQKNTACDDAVKWIKSECKTVNDIVEKCPRGDWGLWLATRINVDEKLVLNAVLQIARTVQHLMNDKRSTDALDTLEHYIENKTTLEEVKIAADAAKSAYYNTAYYTAYHAAKSAYYAAKSAYYAAHTAYNIKYDAYIVADDAYMADIEKDKKHLLLANICREHFGEQLKQKLLAL